MTKEEPMEEMDFEPFQAVIDEQKKYIEALQNEVDSLRKYAEELEKDRDNRDNALLDIEKLVKQYV